MMAEVSLEALSSEVVATLPVDNQMQEPNSHCHDKKEGELDESARRRLLIASVLCLIFVFVEVVGGMIANSLAVVTDAAHLMADFISILINIFSMWISSKPATKKMNFGFYRAEVIGAFASVVLMWIVTGALLFAAVHRIVSRDNDINAEMMLITAAFGLIINVMMGIALQFGGKNHHGHSHGSGTGRDNLSVRAAFIHVVGDFLQSVGVFAAAIIIYCAEDYTIADPICTFLFSILVLFTTFRIVKQTINVLMEGVPKGINFEEVMQQISAVPGVVQVHNLRIWSLSMDKTVLSAHIVIPAGENPISILKAASNTVKNVVGVNDCTLQIEEYKADMESCAQCKEPKN